MKKILVLVLATALVLGCGDGGGDSSSGGSGPLPTVLTGDGGQIYKSTSNTTGVGYGNVVSDGGNPPVLERGVCWGTSPNPTKETAKCASTSAGTGGFSEVIVGILNDGSTVYYMDAYARNPLGISYGRSYQITIKTR